jgi:integrase/recombinase XerD
MQILEATKLFLDYHRMNSKKNTLLNYERFISFFCEQFGERQSDSISTEDVLKFLNQFTEGRKQSTKRLRYSLSFIFLQFPEKLH